MKQDNSPEWECNKHATWLTKMSQICLKIRTASTVNGVKQRCNALPNSKHIAFK